MHGPKSQLDHWNLNYFLYFDIKKIAQKSGLFVFRFLVGWLMRKTKTIILLQVETIHNIQQKYDTRDV